MDNKKNPTSHSTDPIKAKPQEDLNLTTKKLPTEERFDYRQKNVTEHTQTYYFIQYLPNQIDQT